MTDSGFLSNLIGKRVRVVCKDPVDCGDVPVLTLREYSPLGIVGEAGTAQHFFPWTEIVEVSALAASAGALPPVATITLTWRWIRSAASSGSRSYWPSAERYSIATFSPSE